MVKIISNEDLHSPLKKVKKKKGAGERERVVEELLDLME